MSEPKDPATSLPTIVTMPQLGETVTEGILVRWLKQAGEYVDKYESFAEVATDKVNAEIPAPVAGHLTTLLVTEGALVPTGTPIAEIAAIGTNGVAPRVRKDETTPTTTTPPSPPTSVAAETQRHALSPAVRRALQEYGLREDEVGGSGSEGRITLADVERTAAARRENVPTESTEEHRLIPLTRARRAIAEHMVQAKRTIPHAWTMIEVDASRLVMRRQRQRAQQSNGTVPTYFHAFCYALVSTLAEYPMMNARFTDEGIEVPPHVHLAFAVALPENLVVPVIHHADRLDENALARALAAATERARTGHLTAAELIGGTITANNTGANGSILSAPIIHAGQAAIVTMESIVKRPIVTADDAIAIRSMMHICCSIDHRLIDGAIVGGFLSSLKRRIEHLEI